MHQRVNLTVGHPPRYDELYDLERDPHQTHSLWDDPDDAQVKTDVLFRLCNRAAW